ILSTYSVKEKSDYQSDASFLFSGMVLQRIPDHSFSHKDIVITTKYLEWRKLDKLLKEYNVDKIEISCPIVVIKGLFSNLITSYLDVEYVRGLGEILKSTLCLFGKIMIEKEDLEEIVDKLISLLNSKYVEHEI